jgi:hypothetical protein
MSKMSSFYPKYVKIIVWIALGLSLNQCKPSDPEPDPCQNLELFEANFKIQTYFSGSDTTYETDEFILGNTIQFMASEDYDEYLWKLQDDNHTWKTKSFSLTFVNDAYGSFEVTLIAKRKTACAEKSIQVDTIKKSFTVYDFNTPPFVTVENSTQLPFYGSFKGSFTDNPNDEFIIQLIPTNHEGGYLRVYLYNFPRGCGGPNPPVRYGNEKTTSLGIMTYRAFGTGFQYDDNGCIFMYKLFGQIDRDDPNKITITYNIARNNGTTRKFIGFKQQ